MTPRRAGALAAGASDCSALPAVQPPPENTNHVPQLLFDFEWRPDDLALRAEVVAGNRLTPDNTGALYVNSFDDALLERGVYWVASADPARQVLDDTPRRSAPVTASGSRTGPTRSRREGDQTSRGGTPACR